MAQFQFHYFMITSITTITTNFHYYTTTLYPITTIMFLPNLEMRQSRCFSWLRQWSCPCLLLLGEAVPWQPLLGAGGVWLVVKQ